MKPGGGLWVPSVVLNWVPTIVFKHFWIDCGDGMYRIACLPSLLPSLHATHSIETLRAFQRGWEEKKFRCGICSVCLKWVEEHKLEIAIARMLE